MHDIQYVDCNYFAEHVGDTCETALTPGNCSDVADASCINNTCVCYPSFFYIDVYGKCGVFYILS